MLSKHVASIFALILAAPLYAQPAFAATPTSTDAKDTKAPKAHHAGKDHKEAAKNDEKKDETARHEKRRVRGHAHAKRHDHESVVEVAHGREPSVTPRIIETKRYGKGERAETKIDSAPASLLKPVRGEKAERGEFVPPAAATIAPAGEVETMAVKEVARGKHEKAVDAKIERTGKHGVKPPCLHEAVEVLRGTEQGSFSLTKCDGSVAPLATEQLSILARPSNAMKPSTPLATMARIKGSEIAPGVKRMDPNLAVRLQTVIDHFAKNGTPSRIFLVSGYRPSAAGSYHASGHAIDFRIDGVKNEELVSFCKSLPDTGCGYYPNSSFVHIDVRSSGTGHVSWIDASGPGETPRYVGQWPPPEVDMKDAKSIDHADESLLARLDKELPQLPSDDHPAEAQSKDHVTKLPGEVATKPSKKSEGAADSDPKPNDIPAADIVEDQQP